MADSRIPDDVNDAVFALVKQFGADVLSRKTGTPIGTIYNKANPHDSGHHKITLAEAIIWTNISGDLQIAEAFARSVGGVFVNLADMDQRSDEALLDLILNRGVQAGEADQALSDLINQRDITVHGFAKLKVEELQAIAARLVVLHRIEGMVR